MHAVEDRMWWERGLRALAGQLLARALAGSPAAGPVLDAGCGTGGMLLKLGPTVAGRTTLGLEYDVLAAALAASKAGRPVAAGSVNEMPLSGGVLGGYLSLDLPCHDRGETAPAPKEAPPCLPPGTIARLHPPAYDLPLSAP